MTDANPLPRRTYLVQRLKRPHKKTGSVFDNAHRVFGGGMMQISEKLWDILDEVFELDYMGAAEYEFGKVPKTLQEMVKDAKRLKAFSFSIERKDIEENKSRIWRSEETKDIPPPPTTAAKIFVLCRREHEAGAEKTIREIVSGKNKMLKDLPLINYTLDPVRESDCRIVGWFELDNGFFWFTDETMWKKASGLFGVEVP